MGSLHGASSLGTPHPPATSCSRGWGRGHSPGEPCAPEGRAERGRVSRLRLLPRSPCQGSAQTPGRSSRGPGRNRRPSRTCGWTEGCSPAPPTPRASSARPTPPAELLEFVKNTQRHLGNMQSNPVFIKRPRLVLRPECISETGLRGLEGPCSPGGAPAGGPTPGPPAL